jgi:hypothetical protein
MSRVNSMKVPASLKTIVPMVLMCTAVVVASTAAVQRAAAADLSDDAVMAPGALERQRPLRRLVGRRLAADAPLAPGSVKHRLRHLDPCSREILPPGAATRPSQR